MLEDLLEVPSLSDVLNERLLGVHHDLLDKEAALQAAASSHGRMSLQFEEAQFEAGESVKAVLDVLLDAGPA